jgi:VIT1/CCC1 family predicted Fe2+/Mn2+ transporter
LPAGTPRAQAAHERRSFDHTISPVPRRVLDPLERTSEILFGIIMVLTFTGSIRVAEAGREDLRTVLAGAVGCNLAWGLVDAAMYLMAAFITRARLVAALDRIRGAAEPGAAHRIISDILPEPISEALTSPDIELLRQRLTERRSSVTVTPTRTDFLGAAGVFLLVVLSTFPVIVPLMIVRETRLAMGLSNAVAVLLLFVLGWLLGRYAGRPRWRTGLIMVLAGLVLVVVTIALGG